MLGFLAAVTQRPFWSEDQIRKLVRDSNAKHQKLYQGTSGVGQVTSLTDLRAIRIFTSGKQQTWLVADSTTVYCVLDDRRREEPRTQWQTTLENVLPIVADENRSERTGLLRFGGRRKTWLYSKELFLNERPGDAIRRFLLPTNN